MTRDIAERLAKIARRLETRYKPQDVAEFLMRCVFTMFAEDAKLLPEDSFENLLGDMLKRPKDFVPALEDLWERMDKGGYDRGLGATIKRFSGSLFKNAKALPLDADDINEIWIAAKRDWQDVEPAIFGNVAHLQTHCEGAAYMALVGVHHRCFDYPSPNSFIITEANFAAISGGVAGSAM